MVVRCASSMHNDVRTASAGNRCRFGNKRNSLAGEDLRLGVRRLIIGTSPTATAVTNLCWR